MVMFVAGRLTAPDPSPSSTSLSPSPSSLVISLEGNVGRPLASIWPPPAAPSTESFAGVDDAANGRGLLVAPGLALSHDGDGEDSADRAPPPPPRGWLNRPKGRRTMPEHKPDSTRSILKKPGSISSNSSSSSSSSARSAKQGNNVHHRPRVQFDEGANKYFDADYVILIREVSRRETPALKTFAFFFFFFSPPGLDLGPLDSCLPLTSKNTSSHLYTIAFCVSLTLYKNKPNQIK